MFRYFFTLSCLMFFVFSQAYAAEIFTQLVKDQSGQTHNANLSLQVDKKIWEKGFLANKTFYKGDLKVKTFSHLTSKAFMGARLWKGEKYSGEHQSPIIHFIDQNYMKDNKGLVYEKTTNTSVVKEGLQTSIYTIAYKENAESQPVETLVFLWDPQNLNIIAVLNLYAESYADLLAAWQDFKAVVEGASFSTKIRANNDSLGDIVNSYQQQNLKQEVGMECTSTADFFINNKKVASVGPSKINGNNNREVSQQECINYCRENMKALSKDKMDFKIFCKFDGRILFEEEVSF